MILLQGKGASRGAAQGRLWFLRRSESEAQRESNIGPEAEHTRLDLALRRAAEQLQALAERCRSESGEAAAQLFETHALFISDEDLTAAMGAAVNSGLTAEYAVRTACEQFSDMLASMDDAYMRARAADILDISRRITACLTGEEAPHELPDEPVILAADDLAPSETVQLDRSRLLGFATRSGSPGSHTAILARTMGIPAVCALGDSLSDALSGREACLDGESGQLIVDPDEAAKAQFAQRLRSRLSDRAKLSALIGKEDVTADGRTLEIGCNIGSPEDIASVLANDARSVGLFRSEFLYLAADDFPSEEEQFRAYSAAAAAMNGRRVVIRTLDIGADKQAEYFHLPKEENPALGMRAVRICLNRPEIFHTQLRALCRASHFGQIAILFPMIASVWEIRECRSAVQRAMAELEREGIPFDKNIELGAMIETPASALIADRLAAEVDFFSVGTNDLAQYILACDRQSAQLDRFSDPRHPAVLRAVGMAADVARRAGIHIGVCGELAADESMLETFLALGVNELSVPPDDVLVLRRRLRGLRAADCTIDKPNL